MMILDTNVVSETQRPVPDENVMAFLDRCNPTETYITAITVAEILYGIELLPEGARKRALGDAAANLFERTFADRILPFDAQAAGRYARHAAAARGAGQAVHFADGQIAAIALVHDGASVATRDTSPFKAMGVATVDPWTA